MVHLSINECDWSKSVEYWKELTKRIFVSLDDKKKVDFLNKVIFSLPMDNENEKKQENNNGRWGGKGILNFVRSSFWQTPKDLAIKTTKTTTSSHAIATTIKIDPKIEKFVVEPVE